MYVSKQPSLYLYSILLYGNHFLIQSSDGVLGQRVKSTLCTSPTITHIKLQYNYTVACHQFDIILLTVGSWCKRFQFVTYICINYISTFYSAAVSGFKHPDIHVHTLLSTSFRIVLHLY